MLRRLVGLLVAVGLLAGCSGGDARREAVADYIERANRTQAQFELAFRQAQQAIRAFAEGRSTAQTAERLRNGSSVIQAGRASLALVEPPAQARALHRDLLALLDLQARLALEVALAAEYTREIAPAILPAQAAARGLGRKLRAAETGGEQAEALEEYARLLDDALVRLEALAPPPFLRPGHDDRVGRLAASRREARALAAGIRARDAGAVERALAAFMSQPPEDALLEAQRAAVREFNRLLDEQQRLVERIAREQAELMEEFGS